MEQEIDFGSFPDSIYNYLKEYATANGGGFGGKNYSIKTTSLGLTYWIMYSHNEEGSGLNLLVITKENQLLPYGLTLTSLWVDEIDENHRYGKFLNDSTYLQTSVTSIGGIQCDSTITAYRFLKTGKVLIDETLSGFYNKPCDPQ